MTERESEGNNEIDRHCVGKGNIESLLCNLQTHSNPMENPVRMEELKSEQCLQRDVLDLRHHQDDVGVFDYVLKTYFSKIEIFE